MNHDCRYLPVAYTKDLKTKRELFQLTEQQHKMLRLAAQSGSNIFVMLEPTQTDDAERRAGLTQELEAMRSLVGAGILTDITDKFKAQVDAKLGIDRPYIILGFAPGTKEMFEQEDCPKHTKIN